MIKIGFLGLGKMGTPMVRRLLGAGHQVTVWNRSRAAAEALAGEGAIVATTAAEAAANQDAVVTMLFDDAAHEEVLFADSAVLDAIRPGSLHLTASTISVALSDRLAAEHARRNQLYAAVPVFGRPNVAAEGRLWIAAAGSDEAIAKGRPVLESLSRGITIVGSTPSQAHALKLAGNLTIITMIQALSEAVVFAQASGIDPTLLLETVNSALFQSPLYAAYTKLILNPPEPPGGTVELGQKDLNLLLSAARAKEINLSVAELMGTRFAESIVAGLGKADLPAGLLKAAQNASHTN